MTARTLAVDYPVATPPADFVIKAPSQWSNAACTVVGDKLVVLVSGDGLFDAQGKANNTTFTVVVTPKAPYSLASPAPPASLAPGVSGSVVSTYTGGASLVESFRFTKPEGDLKLHLHVLPVKLQSIGFGNTIGDLQRDDGTTYEAPQWQDGDHDNVVPAGTSDPLNKDRHYPVGFVRNTKPTLTDETVVKLGGPLPAGVTLYLTAESNPNGVKVDDAELQVDGSYLATLVDAPVESTEALHDSINYYDAGSSAPGRIFQVDWKVRLAGGNFLALAETRHTLYKTAAMPLLGAFGLRESMVYYACFGARQADPGSTESIADSIQERVFGTKEVKKVPACRAPSMNQISGNPLKFEQAAGTSSGYLPLDGSNVCDAWAALMRDTFRIHGIQSACVLRIVVDNTVKRDGETLQAWLVPVQIFVDGTNTPPNTSSVDKGQGSGGFGSTLGEWGGHSVTALSGAGGPQIYDPSYGLGRFSSLLDYEDSAVAGFRYGTSTYWKNSNAVELKFQP